MNLILKKLSKNNGRLKFKLLLMITSFFIVSGELFAPPEEPISQDLPSPEQPDPVLAALQSQAEGRDASVFGSSESSQAITQGSPSGGISGSGGASGGSNQASQQNQQITVQIGGATGGRARTTTPTAISNRDLTNISNLESRSRITLSMLLDKYNNGTITPAEQIMLDQLIEQNDPYGGLSASDYGFCVNMGGPNAPGSFPGYAFMLLVGGVGISGFFAYAGITAHGDGFNNNLSSKMNANKDIINKVFRLLSTSPEFMRLVDLNPDGDNPHRDLYHVLACVNAESTQRNKKGRNAEDFGRISGIAEQSQELLSKLSSGQNRAIQRLLTTAEGLLGQIDTPGFDSFLIMTANNQGVQERAKKAVSPTAGEQILLDMEDLNPPDSRIGSPQGLIGQSGLIGGSRNRATTEANLRAEAQRRATAPQDVLDAEDAIRYRKDAAAKAADEVDELERLYGRKMDPDERIAEIESRTRDIYFKNLAIFKKNKADQELAFLQMRRGIQPPQSAPQAPLPSAPPIRQPAINPAYNPTLDVYGQRSPQFDSGVGLDQLQRNVDALAELAQQNPRQTQYYSPSDALRSPYAQPVAASRPVMVSRDAQADPLMRSIGVQADVDRSIDRQQQLQAQRAIAQSREIATGMTMVPEPAPVSSDRLPAQQGTEPAPAPRIQQPQIGRQVSPTREIPAFRTPQPQPLQRRNSSPALLQPLRINR